MKFRTIAAIAPLVLFAGTALQAQNTPSDAASPKPAVKEKKVCRTEDDTGSIVPKRVCHTKAEWEAIAVQEQNVVNTDAVRNGQRR